MTYLSQERTIKRKVQEAVVTLWLEQKLSKEDILTRYLNTAYFGAGVYGVDAAAKRYFGKTAKELSLSELAMLAGLVRAPSTLAPHRNLDGARQRAGMVLDAMVETGAISTDEAEAARQQPATLRIPPDNPPGTNYFVDMLNGDLKRLIGSVTADLTLRSDLSISIFRASLKVSLRDGSRQKAVPRKLVKPPLLQWRPTAQFSRWWEAAITPRVSSIVPFRQSGSRVHFSRRLSTLRRLEGAKSANDSGRQIDPDRKLGADELWRPLPGEVALRTAFANSINSVAVQLAESVGIPTVIETARKLGVQSDLPAVPSLALGSGEVTLLEMTRAFAAIAANAESVEPYAVRAVRSGDQVLYARPNTTLQPAGNPTARVAIRDFLASVVREGTGKAARVSIPSAGKTGTTQQNKDAWFVGYTSDIVVGVWVGNDDSSPTRNVTGGDLPARMWNEFVTQSMAARTKIARAQLQTLVPAGSEGTNAKAIPSGAAVRGQPVVKNTGTLDFRGRVIRLFGVEGTRGRPTRDFRRYLGPREVVCEPADSSSEYRCRVDDQDLSRVVLFNGGGRAKANAPPEFRALEQQARSSRVGIWGGDEDDED